MYTKINTCLLQQKCWHLSFLNSCFKSFKFAVYFTRCRFYIVCRIHRIYVENFSRLLSLTQDVSCSSAWSRAWAISFLNSLHLAHCATGGLRRYNLDSSWTPTNFVTEILILATQLKNRTALTSSRKLIMAHFFGYMQHVT